MNWKNRLTNYNFWISIVSAVLLILQAFNIEFDVNYINEIITAVLGLLVVIGIINDPTKNGSKTSSSSTTTSSTSSNDGATETTTNEAVNVVDSEKEMPIVNKDETNNIDSSDNMEIFVEDTSRQSTNSSENISNTDAVTNNTVEQMIEQIAGSGENTFDNIGTQEENKSDAHIDEGDDTVNNVLGPVMEEGRSDIQQDANINMTNTSFNIVNN